MNYLTKQKITDDDAEKIVDIIYENENVEMLKNNVIQMADEAYRSVSSIQNDQVNKITKLLIKSVIEDL